MPDVSKDPAPVSSERSIPRRDCFTIKAKTLQSLKTSVNIYPTTQRSIPEDFNTPNKLSMLKVTSANCLPAPPFKSATFVFRDYLLSVFERILNASNVIRIPIKCALNSAMNETIKRIENCFIVSVIYSYPGTV